MLPLAKFQVSYPVQAQRRYQVLKTSTFIPFSATTHTSLTTSSQPLDEVDIMPNISFDIFFQDDIINITASRSGGSAPKVKPAWKVRTAPKLPPKEPPLPKAAAAFGSAKAKQIETKQLTETKPAVKPKAEKPTPKPKEAAKANGIPKKPTEVKKSPKLKDAANAKAVANTKAGAKSAST